MLRNPRIQLVGIQELELLPAGRERRDTSVDSHRHNVTDPLLVSPFALPCIGIALRLLLLCLRWMLRGLVAPPPILLTLVALEPSARGC